jgi:type IV pilus assembly protein PilB
MPIAPFDQKIIDALKSLGLISSGTAEQIQSRLQAGESLEEEIIKNKFVPEQDFFRVKANIFDLPFADLREKLITPDILSIIPKDVAATYQMICFSKVGDTLQIALANPSDFKAYEAAEFLIKGTSFSISYFVTSKSGFDEAFKKYEELPKEIEKVLEIAKERVVITPEEEERLIREIPETPEAIKAAPVSRIVAVIIRHAVERGASDIHIEPSDKESRVRYRIDGVLEVALTLPAKLHPAIVARIKVLSNLRLDETRRPQDGRIRVRFDHKEIDLRVSTLPLLDNEKVVMRVLDISNAAIELADLGFEERAIKIIRYAIGKPNGIFLITGPTGSGKTTTLMACLHVLNKEGVNIVTVEDPIEYFIKGVNQSQINPEVGVNFASGLRSILRQDPNIIMVGEIRDTETAELVIHAGLTGHLVLTTLHTKDSFGALPRLIDMKIEPFLIASTLNAVSAQRLVRKICEYCKEKLTIPKDVENTIRADLKKIPSSYLKENANLSPSSPLVFYKGKGCPRCNDTGYKGRMVIAEFLVNTDELQKIIVTGCKQDDLVREFRRQNMLTIKEDGLLRALQGLTTIEEVLRVVQE